MSPEPKPTTGMAALGWIQRGPSPASLRQREFSCVAGNTPQPHTQAAARGCGSCVRSDYLRYAACHVSSSVRQPYTPRGRPPPIPPSAAAMSATRAACGVRPAVACGAARRAAQVRARGGLGGGARERPPARGREATRRCSAGGGWGAGRLVWRRVPPRRELCVWSEPEAQVEALCAAAARRGGGRRKRWQAAAVAARPRPRGLPGPPGRAEPASPAMGACECRSGQYIAALSPLGGVELREGRPGWRVSARGLPAVRAGAL